VSAFITVTPHNQQQLPPYVMCKSPSSFERVTHETAYTDHTPFCQSSTK